MSNRAATELITTAITPGLHRFTARKEKKTFVTLKRKHNFKSSTGSRATKLCV